MKKNSAWIIFCAAVVLSAGGLVFMKRGDWVRKPEAKFSKFQGYDAELRVAFQYPEGWRLEQEKGTIDRYQKVRLLGYRNQEGTYTCYLSVVGFPKKESGGKFETLEEFARNYKEHLLIDSKIEAEVAHSVAGQKAIDLTVSYTIPPLYKHGLKAIEIPVKTRTLFAQKGPYLYQITYSADAREYDLHAQAFEQLLKTFRFQS